MNKKILQYLWEAWCCCSLVGIWPRHIEPRSLSTSKLSLPILPSGSIKILQFTDLHLSPLLSDRYLEKLRNHIQRWSPDIIVFTGDFLCGSKLEDPERLQKFLSSLHAPCGCFAILGNHDYQEPLSINEEGSYDITSYEGSNLLKGFFRLFATLPPTGVVTQKAQSTPPHAGLLDLLEKTPFKLLHNQCIQVDSTINLCGLGEYMAGRCDPKEAFQSYDPTLPGIILSHNPDSVALLKDYPGDLILSGHTHGAQVNLPWFRNKLCLLEKPKLQRGLLSEEGKQIYVNRGIGGLIPFRWFSKPEILQLTLESKHE